MRSTSSRRTRAPARTVAVVARVALTVAACALAPGHGVAAEVGAAEAAHRSLDIACFGPEAECSRLAAAIVPLLPNDPRVVWSPPAAVAPRPDQRNPAPTGSARLWIDARQAGAIRIVTMARDTAPVWRTINAPALDPVTVEIVAQVARDTARALLDGRAPVAPELPAATPSLASAGNGDSNAGPALVLVTSPSPPAPRAPPDWSLALSAGYLARAIFDLSAPGGPSLPLAQGVALGAALSIPLRRVTVFSSLSLEYHRVTDDSPGCQHVPACTAQMVHDTFSGGAAYGLFGVSGRPARFFEIGAGLGGGLGRNQVDRPGTDGPRVWRAAARGLVSLAVVDLPAGLQVTAALTMDRTFGDFYGRPASQEPAPLASFQTGGLLSVGWRM